MRTTVCTPNCPERCRPWGSAAPGRAACMDPTDPFGRRFVSVTLDAPCIRKPEPDPTLFEEVDR